VVWGQGQVAQGQLVRIPSGSWALIQRAANGVLGSAAGLELTFKCPFCLENVQARERVVLRACGNQDHGVCRECMGQYIRSLVGDGRSGAPCHECGALAFPREVLELTDDATYRRFERFRQMHQDHRVRECPQCGALCTPITEEGQVQAEMQCAECDCEFCYYHSSAHAGRSCEEYRTEMAREERLLEKGAMRGTKSCPECGIRTEKTGGCNHMNCDRCNADWCWMCGEKLDDVTEHYWFGGPTGCRQFEDEDRNSGMARCVRCVVVALQMAFSVVFSLLFVPLTLTLLVWLPFFCLCFVPCHRCSISSDAMFAAVVCSVLAAYLPIVLFQVVWTLVALALWFLLRPFGARRTHLLDLVQIPLASVSSVARCILSRSPHAIAAATSSSSDEESEDSEDTAAP